MQGLMRLIMKELIPKHYNSLIDLINEYEKNECSFIMGTKEYQDLDSYFKSFFGDNFKYNEIKKLYFNCFIYKDYIIKFKDHKNFINIPKLDEIVNVYFQKNFVFKVNNNNILYLAVEIQDYLYPNCKCEIEEIYILYKRLREKGYIWMDASLSNAVKYHNKAVIIDTDYIYLEEKANYIVESKMSKEFAKKYLEDNCQIDFIHDGL